MIAACDPDSLSSSVGGKPLETLSIATKVGDTSIAVVHDGQIYPGSPGRTTIELTLCCQTWFEVTVHTRAASPETMQSQEIAARKRQCAEAFGL